MRRHNVSVSLGSGRYTYDGHNMIIMFAWKSMSFDSSSSIFDGFFSIPSRALCVLSYTNNDVTRIFHNRKMDFSSNFSISNLVVMVILLAILWY